MPRYDKRQLMAQLLTSTSSKEAGEIRTAMLLNFLREVEWILNAENNTIGPIGRSGPLMEIDREAAAKLHAEALAWIKRLAVS